MRDSSSSNVASGAAVFSSSVVNVATVSGGGETNTANDRASDPTTIAAATATATDVFRINAGGSAYTDTAGKLWTADANFSGGSAYTTTTTAIAGTVEDPLFRSERYGTFSYTLPVANGTYTVTLYFAEIYWTSAGKRVFDVLVENQLALNDLDIWSVAGANAALVRTVQATVSDGVLNINFVPVVDNAKVSAIQVTASSSGPPPTADLVLAKSHVGSFAQGQTGATYTLTVTNRGSGPTTGTVTVRDTLPAGLIATAMVGTGWTCTQPAGPCTRSDTLAAGSSYPVLTLTVNVASNAPLSVTNTANVGGGGETNTTNDTASDPTTILPPDAAWPLLRRFPLSRSQAGDRTRRRVTRNQPSARRGP